MPRYYFNIYDGVSTPDDTGTELADWREARLQAIECAGAIIRDEAERIALGEDWRIEVTDERQRVLFRFDFISLEAPALSSHRNDIARTAVALDRSFPPTIQTFVA